MKGARTRESKIIFTPILMYNHMDQHKTRESKIVIKKMGETCCGYRVSSSGPARQWMQLMQSAKAPTCKKKFGQNAKLII